MNDFNFTFIPSGTMNYYVGTATNPYISSTTYANRWYQTRPFTEVDYVGVKPVEMIISKPTEQRRVHEY